MQPFARLFAEVLVHFRRRRAGCSDVGGRNRLPAVLRRAPERQRISPDSEPRSACSSHRKRFIDIDFPAVVVGAGDCRRLRTGFCLHVWRGEERKVAITGLAIRASCRCFRIAGCQHHADG